MERISAPGAASGGAALHSGDSGRVYRLSRSEPQYRAGIDLEYLVDGIDFLRLFCRRDMVHRLSLDGDPRLDEEIISEDSRSNEVYWLRKKMAFLFEEPLSGDLLFYRPDLAGISL